LLLASQQVAGKHDEFKVSYNHNRHRSDLICSSPSTTEI
jgi:hypothetical protein